MLPINLELLFALEAEHARRKPQPKDRVLINARGGHAVTGGTRYDVAKILADTIETVERHYAPFTKELGERVRGLIEGRRFGQN